MSARGAALVEFALTLPLILLFVAGIYDLGKVQSQINTLAQAAYQISFIGATSPRTTGDTTMTSEGAKILNLVTQQTNYFKSAPTLDAAPSNPTGTTRYFQDGGKWYVTVTVTGSLDSFFKWMFPAIFTVHVSSTAPYLYSSSNLANPSIDGYQNGPNLSDCDGTILSGGGGGADYCNKICGCAPGSDSSLCQGLNTPRVCYQNF